MGLGLILGLRHAFEGDHLAAVATIVSRERSPLRSGSIGVSWGAGHLTSLLLVGVPLVGLGLHFPRGFDLPLESPETLMKLRRRVGIARERNGARLRP